MYLLDTNACLDFLLARSDALRRRIEREFGRLAVSSITAAELHVGNRRSVDPIGDARRIDIFLSGIDVVPFDDAAARAYGEVARNHGVARHSFDRLIAAHAVALDHILVTNNVTDFQLVPGLRIENWTQ